MQPTVPRTHFAFHSQTLNQPRPSLLKRQKTKDQASHFGCLVIRWCITIRVFEHQRHGSLFASFETGWLFLISQIDPRGSQAFLEPLMPTLVNISQGFFANPLGASPTFGGQALVFLFWSAILKCWDGFVPLGVEQFSLNFFFSKITKCRLWFGFVF